MVKCEICKEKIEETFLDKIKGTYFKKGKKLKPVCQTCQKTKKPEEIIEKLGLK